VLVPRASGVSGGMRTYPRRIRKVSVEVCVEVYTPRYPPSVGEQCETRADQLFKGISCLTEFLSVFPWGIHKAR
jgi:hypothetical protein